MKSGFSSKKPLFRAVILDVLLREKTVEGAEKRIPKSLFSYLEAPYDSSIKSDVARLKFIDQIIAVDFAKKLTAEDIAAKLYISLRQLDRITKKRYGKSVRKLIIEKRIDTATELLCTTNMTADKIGITVGFASKAGFLREFHKKYGSTPTEYRKAHRSKTNGNPH